MPSPKQPAANKSGVWAKIRPLLVLSDHKRPWGAHVTVALAVGLPAIIGVWFNHFAIGSAASIGGLASLYLRQTPLSHRMITMALVTFGFCTSFTVCLLASFNPWLTVAALGFVAFWATFICRYFAVPPPGSFFFIVIASVASSAPFELSLLPQRAGLLLFGCMGASVLALAYSLIQLLSGNTSGIHSAEPTEQRVVAILLESATIAAFIAASYLIALWLGFDRPYWAPISCAAVLQGASFRAVRHRNIHRIMGTAIGMGLTWALFSLTPGPWALALAIIALCFVIELLITRNYGFAVIFITPLTIILAEAESASSHIDQLILQRMTDVILGCSVGYIGGWFLYHQKHYRRLEQRLLGVFDK
ncbi:FUSC family protein [Dasania sp. GY-MA-18]|uniref:FUSC family protein n=1 Tax=Dasania phycosphaerae TaxID=2950436 RepID=A0A9J6RL60_9GAMM|nr:MULTISPECIES: FUSC family protein [Dasania]MCR8922805.1 FUSC family protein [Dasania sp. GY-MA-18]MCZ0865235.1 FUSC family protein [Dasania phycosphaerae]MCZ0868961.1 FUSC family protein [Dasania phycosphaerae]